MKSGMRSETSGPGVNKRLRLCILSGVAILCYLSLTSLFVNDIMGGEVQATVVPVFYCQVSQGEGKTSFHSVSSDVVRIPLALTPALSTPSPTPAPSPTPTPVSTATALCQYARCLGTATSRFGVHGAGLHDTPFHQLAPDRWVLIVNYVGASPENVERNFSADDRLLYQNLQQRYGLIVRYDYGFNGSGTVPPSEELYDDFARTVATHVRLYLVPDKPSPPAGPVVVVGNEMNNPREWPWGQPISPTTYAEIFNIVYREVKSVLPTAQVIPGAVDPYNDALMKADEYQKRLLEGIAMCDGISLHLYSFSDAGESCVVPQPLTNAGTHWDVWAAIRLKEAIPARFRHLPLYITEFGIHRYTPAGALSPSLGWPSDVPENWLSACTGFVLRLSPRAILFYRTNGDEWTIPQEIWDFVNSH